MQSIEHAISGENTHNLCISLAPEWVATSADIFAGLEQHTLLALIFVLDCLSTLPLHQRKWQNLAGCFSASPVLNESYDGLTKIETLVLDELNGGSIAYHDGVAQLTGLLTRVCDRFHIYRLARD